LPENLQERENFEKLGADGRITFKLTLKKYGVMIRNGLSWSKVGPNHGHLRSW
jgi:hypothetical protein